MTQPAILIVEDDLTFAHTLEQALRLGSGSGYQVSVCISAEAAYDLLDARRFDLLVSDYRLPGEDGLSLISKARECCPQMNAILMTGVGSQELEAAARQISQGYLTKPFDMLDLLLIVQQALSPVSQPGEVVSAEAVRQWRIMILEDDAGLRKIYTRALQKLESFRIEEAATLADARIMLDNAEYDILISDMRIGRDRATDLLSEYGEKLKSAGTKVVMCSAFGQYRGLPAQVDYFLEKPISLERLVNLVNSLTSSQLCS